ncbi:MAG TPA: hypothetical protein VF919_02200 [Gemmatimonadales bacterium]
MEFAQGGGKRTGGTAWRVLEAPPKAFIIIHSLFVLAELSYITYHAGLTHFLFAHIIAEVCDALALVTIALGLSQRVAPLVPGALQNR